MPSTNSNCGAMRSASTGRSRAPDDFSVETTISYASNPANRLKAFEVSPDQHIGSGEQDLRRRNRELETIVESRSQLIAMAAHDLRNPIGNIFVISELLLDDSVHLTGRQRELVQTIEVLSEYTQRLLDSIFDLSMMESDSFRLSFELLDLSAILEQVVSSNRAIAERRGININFHVDGVIPRINLDMVKIEQVFSNLVDNAIKYSQDGATVIVRVRSERDAVLVSVRDNGPGISPQDLKTLFTPFQRTLGRANHAGRGLGLAIAKRIVARHGGQIWVESEVGMGSTFFVLLPLQN